MNGKDLMMGLNFIDERFVQEAEEKQLKKSNLVFLKKYGSLAACFAVVFIAAIGILRTQENVVPPDIIDVPPSITDVPPDIVDIEPNQPNTYMLDLNSVKVNEVARIGESDVWYDPALYEIQNWTNKEIADYYGVELSPSYIPEGLFPSIYNGSAEVVYTKDGTIVNDQITFGYYTDFYEDGSPMLYQETGGKKGISVQVSKIGNLAACDYILPLTEQDKTIIDGIEVIVGQFPASSTTNGFYIAEFEVNAIQYKIIGYQIELEEFLKVVTSVIRGDSNITATQ